MDERQGLEGAQLACLPGRCAGSCVEKVVGGAAGKQGWALMSVEAFGLDSVASGEPAGILEQQEDVIAHLFLERYLQKVLRD